MVLPAKTLATVTLLIIFCVLETHGFMGGMGRGGGGIGMGMRGGGMGMRGRGGMMGGKGMNRMGLPPGMAMIDGEMLDMSNKVVQQLGGSAGGRGTTYYSYFNQKGPPLFTRRETDTNRKYVVFPDRNYPPGDGHYIVLRRMKRSAMKRGPIIYEAFYLDLGDSIKAMVSSFNSNSFGGGAGGGMGMGMRGGGRMPGRMKRKTVLPGSHELADSYEKPRRRHRHQKPKRKEKPESGNKKSLDSDRKGDLNLDSIEFHSMEESEDSDSIEDNKDFGHPGGQTSADRDDSGDDPDSNETEDEDDIFNDNVKINRVNSTLTPKVNRN